MWPITRAGLPATTAPAATSRTTTAPAPTSAFSPTTTPGRIVAFAPILAACRITGPASWSFTPGDRGYLAFVNTTLGPIQQSVLEHRVFRNERLGVNANTVADRDVMLDDRQRTDADVVADLVELSNVDLVPGLEIGADDVAGVDDRMRSDHGAVPDRRRELAFSRFARRGANHAEVLDDCARAE